MYTHTHTHTHTHAGTHRPHIYTHTLLYCRGLHQIIHLLKTSCSAHSPHGNRLAERLFPFPSAFPRGGRAAAPAGWPDLEETCAPPAVINSMFPVCRIPPRSRSISRMFSSVNCMIRMALWGRQTEFRPPSLKQPPKRSQASEQSWGFRGK